MEAIDFGICRLALVPVRKSPGFSTEQVNQLLFGEHYEVFGVSPDKKWVQIKTTPDPGEGWIDAGHHHPIAREYYEQINHADFKITTDITASILYKKSAITILMGSIVPISTSELFKMEEQLAFNGETKSLGQKRDSEFVRTIALKYINAPSQPGGKSPFGIDAVGLVQMVFKISGYNVPREISRLALIGKKVNDAEDASCGDVAVFGSEEGGITHCGLILEDDKIIHSYGRVRIDHLNEEGILNSETRIYSHHLMGIRRLLSE